MTRSAAPALLIALLGCDRPAAPPPDVLIITVDTARADRFSYAGSPVAKTPRIDALAHSGAAFSEAISPAPITLVAHASIFTGQDPTVHGVHDNGTFVLGPEASTLAERFAEAGRPTGAFIGAAVLDERYGLNQGFDRYDDEVGEDAAEGLFQYGRRRGEDVVAAALAWRETQGLGPALTWVHLFDAHSPYAPPQPEASQHANPYDGELAYVDRVVGDLLAGWTQLGLSDNTVVVLTSDHGESLGEHGEATHGVFIYDATLRVPLIIRAPSLAPQTIDVPVGLVDLAPTVLALAGLPADPAHTGQDLSPLVQGRPGFQPQPLYVESAAPLLHYGWAPLRGMRSGSHKLIIGAETELYDLTADPGETNDISTTQEILVRPLVDALNGRWPAVDLQGSLELDEDTRSQLAALGYIWQPDADAQATRADPREGIRALAQMDAADARYQAGDIDGAVAAYQDLVTAQPTNLEAASRLGDLQFLAGRHADAEATWGQALKHTPGAAQLHANRGLALERLLLTSDALDAYSAALAIDPAQPLARRQRWGLLTRAGQHAQVAGEARAVADATPNDGEAHAAAILAELRDRPPGDIADAAESALASLPDDPDLLLLLADARTMEGRNDRAAEAFERVLARRPGHVRAATGLGRLFLVGGQVPRALETLTGAYNGGGRHWELLVALGEARARSNNTGGALTVLEEAARLAPGEPAVWSTTATVQLGSGQAQTAVALYNKAIELGDPNPEVWFNLAVAHRAMGQDPEAAAAQRKYDILTAG